MSEQRENQREPWNDLKAEPYVRIESITKRFGSVAAVNNVSLKIYRGEIFCLLGGGLRQDDLAAYAGRLRAAIGR